MNFRPMLHLVRRIDAWLIPPAILLVVYGELTHGAFVDILTSSIWDKTLHFTAYFGLCLMTTIAVRAGRQAWRWALALVLMGGALEIIQDLTGRDGDIFDEFANALGVITGLGVGWVGVVFLKTRNLVDAARPD